MTSDANTDRFFIALAGFLGFGGTFIAALSLGGDDVSSALLRAAVGMLAGAGLMKLLIFMAHSAFRDAVRDKQMKEKINEGKPAPAPAQGAPKPAPEAVVRPVPPSRVKAKPPSAS
jgi:hypothetical protein